MAQQRTYNIRYPLDRKDYPIGTVEYPNGTRRTIEDAGNGLLRVTWDDSGFWEKH
jgi:hypothetical protein